MTYFNGVVVGATGVEVTNHRRVKRRYRVPASAARAGTATIAVRVWDRGGEGGLIGPANAMWLAPAGAAVGERQSLAGDWRFNAERTLPTKPNASGLDSKLPSVLEAFLAMHDELVMSDAEKQAFLADEASIIVGRQLAREQGWKLDDRIVFQSRAFPGEWALTIAGTFEAERGEWAKRQVWRHYDRLDRAVPLTSATSFSSSRLRSSSRTREGRSRRRSICTSTRAPCTLSMEDRVLWAVNVGRIGAVLAALDFVSYLILVVVLARQSKIADDPLLLRHVGFEPMLVAEEQLRALALVDERIEGGKDVDAVLPGREALLQRLGPRPVGHLRGALDLDRTSSPRRADR